MDSITVNEKRMGSVYSEKPSYNGRIMTVVGEDSTLLAKTKKKCAKPKMAKY